ncbi:uncharacterized protein EDB91DRAFT_1092499 [Suillus paluster]|uniref:uncharacterized protein n=1 Tax=Suillus paluster TaxID=48578 RepID=UPI001B871687|nr:uncharacterized protein EDB91DRAFT_1092499 [Suillus paluster]KAG1756405.1 hypothetical protein EDB91DRAFT_1092499 [Suillus paluster]
MARYSSPNNRKSNSRMRSSMSKAFKSPVNSDKSRLLGRNRLDQDDEDDSADSDWDEHTLIALLDDGEEAPDLEDGAAIVNRLQPAFTAHGRDVKKRFRDTLIPVITRVGEAHKLFSHEIHPTLLRGAALFHNNSRALEDAARREHDQVVSTFARMKEALGGISLQLQDVCAESDQLFGEYEKVINRHGIFSWPFWIVSLTTERSFRVVQLLRDYAKTVPGDIERLISKRDKTHKSVAAEDHAKAKEKLLRGILDRY